MKTISKILVFSTFLFVLGCGSTKVITNTEKTDLSLVSKKDSIRIVERNRRIQDSLKIKIAQSNTGNKEIDQAVNAKLSEILSQLNMSKSSGDNSFKFEYDDFLKELRATAVVGQTENVKNIFNKEIHTKEIILKHDEVPVKFIPQYVLIAAIFGGCMFFALIGFVVYKISGFLKPKTV